MGKARFEASGFRTWLTVWCLAFVISCTGSSPGPVPLHSSDMCDYCRMAISEKRYAAELLDKQGDAYKFDDIGCLLNFVKRNRPAVTAYFFVDQESGAWLKPEKAFFVRSSKFKTPMNSSIVAFADQEKAQAVAQETGGELLSFEQLTAREG